MKKFYSLVLIAAALLIGTNAWANYDANWLQDQFDAIQADGQTHTIVMEDDINLIVPVYLGTATVDGARKSIILDMNGHHITMNATNWVSSHPNVFCSVFNITHGKLLIKNSKKSTTTSLIQFTGTAYGKYNDIFNVAGSYKSSRWVKNGSGVYEISESAAKNTRDANGGWFTHLIIDEGVKLYAPNTVFGAGISIDGYYTNFHGQVSPDATTKSVFGTTSLTGSTGNISLYNRADAPLYNTAIMSAASGGKGDGFAYGVRVEVYGDIEFASDATNASGGKSYGIKLNGGLRSTLKTRDYFHPDYCKNMDEAYIATYGATAVTQTNLVIDSVGTYRDHYFNHRDDTIDAPFLYIGKTAHIIASAELNEATAIYCSGYGKTLIEGACSGNSGINVKSGTVEIHDAEITCTATKTSVYAAEGGNNATGTGAVVVNSVEGRAGGIEVIISGDSKVSTDYGYAIAETVNTITEGTKVSSITIDGGTIQGGASSDSYDGGAIIISEETKDGDVVVYGTNLTGNTNVQVGGDGDLDELTPNDVIVTEVIVDGKPTVVVSQGETPDEVGDAATDSEYSIRDADEASITWTGTVDQIIDENKTLDYLEMNLTTGTTPKTPVPQQLTIKSGYTLTVGRVVLGEAAVIIVKPGAKFIVNGTQGIVAPSVDNIVLEASETDQAVFLFNPNVTSNRHPNATVEFKSKAYLNGSKGVFQRFGVPTWDREAKNTAMVSTGAAKTWITQYDYTIDDWAAWTAYDYATNITITDARPFRGYMLYSNNDKDHKMEYKFAGNLIGNQNEDLHMYYGWNYFANSYTAPISIKDLINTVMASLDADKKDYVLGTIYLYKNTGEDDYTWSGVNLSTPKQAYEIVDGIPVPVQNQVDIQPMQAFLMRLNLIDGQMDQPISYKYDVYNPNMGIANNNQYLAPARSAQANNEMQVLVSGEGSWDKVYVVENNNFSNDFENGYDAYKYDGKTGVNLYAMSSDARMEILATDDAEGTFLGIDAPKAGNYTLHVAGVEGMEYAIVDMETNAVINAVNGTKYQFYANAGANDYRFQVVKAAKLPTAIDNTEAGKSVKGVYTLTGQFLGNDVNVLPAGVYIVNGVKVVK